MAARSDVRLREYSLETLPRLGKLRNEILEQKPHICIERAQRITDYLRDSCSDKTPEPLRYAGAVRHFLFHKQPLFFDDNLLAGTTTSKPLGAPVYPELTGMTIWPELDTISSRGKYPLILSSQDASILNSNIFPYWMERTILERTRRQFNNPECLKLAERFIFFIAGKAGCISHTVPSYATAVKQGIRALRAEAQSKAEDLKGKKTCPPGVKEKILFYDSVALVLEGVLAYARNLSRQAAACARNEADTEKQKHFDRLAQLLERVPAEPAQTFYEAVNSLWILHIAIHAENINMAISPGRLDQILFPYYQHDCRQGSLSTAGAMEIIGCLWLKFNDNINLVPAAAEELFGGAGTVPAVTLGGVDLEGNNAVNDLTYMMLRVTELLQTRDPNVNARYHYQKNPKSYRDRLAELIAATSSVPAVHNDVKAIATLENQGIKKKHARDFAIIGCVELSSAGRSYDASSAIMLNLASALEMALYNGRRPVAGDQPIGPLSGDPREFKTYDQFWDAFTQQLNWIIKNAVTLNELFGKTHQKYMPTPLLSALFEGPLQKGKDLIYGGARYNSSGATHIGFADTVDSLCAIEQAVFIKKYCTWDELLRALESDFQGYDALYAYCVNKTPKYGTLHSIAVKNARRLIEFLYHTYQRYTNYRKGAYRPAFWTMTNHVGQGKFVSALPNGRRKASPLASGITPVRQSARDLTACLKALGEIDRKYIPGGEALNLKYPPIQDEKDVARLGDTIEAYFKIGGLQIQFNLYTYQTLLDAKKNPEKYPDLLVRVSGYSAYFKDLTDEMKNEIITRTEYDLKTGQANPFPCEHRDMTAPVMK